MRTIGLISILGVLAGCTSLECDPGFHVEGDACVPDVAPDTGMSDSGPDTGDTDAGTDAPMACGGACTGAMPHCDTDTDTCVACLDDSHCDEMAPVCSAGGVCGPCTGPADCAAYPDALVCGDSGAADGTCVACAGDSDCTDADAGKCDTTTNTCVPCDDSDQCTEDGAGICDMSGESGLCVECTIDTEETACGLFSCNPATNECTETERGDVTRCGACVADSECGLPDDRCVPMNFMGTPRATGYCLKQFDTGCVRPHSVPTDARASLSGAAAETYCGVLEASVTCEAVQDLIDDTACGSDDECGAEGLEDGRCETVNGTAERCTYDCTGASECTGATMCGAAGRFCGAPAT